MPADSREHARGQADRRHRCRISCAINGELRQKNTEKIASYAKQSSPDILWGGIVFHPFTNTAVEAAFADQRTYVYNGKDVDRQTHLGFDLARVVNSPIVAANRGKVLYAAPLGIYGNCVILDHGMGVQSLYGHLSSIARQGRRQTVQKEQELGKSGMTGMAGGDHLHFTMLVNGQMVNPVEWWDAHWIQDRILRKLREASRARIVTRSRPLVSLRIKGYVCGCSPRNRAACCLEPPAAAPSRTSASAAGARRQEVDAATAGERSPARSCSKAPCPRIP